jgi:hypothetical protein
MNNSTNFVDAMSCRRDSDRRDNRVRDFNVEDRET